MWLGFGVLLALPMAGSEKLSLAGFHVVDRAPLKALPGVELERLAQQNILELIFDHLLSLEQLSALVELISVAENADKASTPQVK